MSCVCHFFCLVMLSNKLEYFCCCSSARIFQFICNNPKLRDDLHVALHGPAIYTEIKPSICSSGFMVAYFIAAV